MEKSLEFVHQPARRAQKPYAGRSEPPALASIYRFALAKSTCNRLRFFLNPRYTVFRISLFQDMRCPRRQPHRPPAAAPPRRWRRGHWRRWPPLCGQSHSMKCTWAIPSVCAIPPNRTRINERSSVRERNVWCLKTPTARCKRCSASGTVRLPGTRAVKSGMPGL